MIPRYVGFSGRVRLPTRALQVDQTEVPVDRRGPPAGERHVRQWLHPAASGGAPARPVAGARCLLSGGLEEPAPSQLAERVVSAVMGGRFADLARVRGELTGSVVTDDRVLLFRSVTSDDQVFFRRTGPLVEWSTDPTDLVHDRAADLDRDLLWRSCRGEDVFVYRNLDFVRPGQLVVLGPRTTEVVRYDAITPLDLPRRTGLREYARRTYDLLLQASEGLAGLGRIGVLLSGGVDSSIVLMALKDSGADVTAYHMGTEAPLADESHYAREVCRCLSVPLVSVTTRLDRYFSSTWDFPHPFNHVWFRRISEIADRVRSDGVTVLATGLGADILFGPLHYGLHDVLAGDVSWGEKWHMALGVLASRWELARIVRSLAPSYSLLRDAQAIAEVAAPVDILVPMPHVPPESYDLDFIPQEHTLNLSVWRPRAIWTVKPLGSRELRRLAARLPDAYRLIPHRGRMIDKPVLRLIAADRLPPLIWRHYGRDWLQSQDEAWCVGNPDVFAGLIGAPGSRLVELGIVDPERLAAVLADPAAVRRNTEALVSSAMTELFLRSLERTSLRAVEA